MTIADKTERNAASTRSRTSVLVALAGTADEPGTFAGARAAGQGGVPLAAEEGRPQPHRQRGRAHRRPWPHRPPAALGRGRRPADRARLRPVPAGRDPGAQRRARSACPAWTRCSTRSRSTTKKRYMHHYNFPPFSTGETGRVGSPEAPRDRPRRARRAGAAAGRARARRSWPYTLRLVSEVLSSNGSTSMASVCGSTLSLMDAGVPIKAPVAGIAMGLVYAEGKYTTLTDILGAEDAFGDMDFKVAGTADVRHRAAARHQDRRPPGRRAGRRRCSRPRTPASQILEVMNAAIAEPRAEVGATGAEDRQLRDPDRQDRRGHRAQGQGHQHDPAGDRRRHLRRRRRHGRHGHASARPTAAQVDEAERRIELILDPPTAERRRRSTPAGS